MSKRMKLIERKVVMNPETFKPELIVTIALDMELAEGQMAIDPDEYFVRAGKEFVELLENI